MTDSAKWNTIVGCILASKLESKEKYELIDFVRMWEERSDIYDD